MYNEKLERGHHIIERKKERKKERKRKKERRKRKKERKKAVTDTDIKKLA
jgi:hypothetical protein